jgi:hypothetical protein
LALLLATSFVLVNLLVDILYGVFDPRARVGEGTAKGTGNKAQGAIEKKPVTVTLAKEGA